MAHNRSNEGFLDNLIARSGLWMPEVDCEHIKGYSCTKYLNLKQTLAIECLTIYKCQFILSLNNLK